MDERLRRFIQTTFRGAGRRYAETVDAYRAGQMDAATSDLPRDEDGRVHIVCRRYVERRAVGLDEESRPTCFDEGHVDCEGCAEDVREGVVETW